MKKLETIKYFSKNGFSIIDLWTRQYHRNITQTINKKINVNKEKKILYTYNQQEKITFKIFH